MSNVNIHVYIQFSLYLYELLALLRGQAVQHMRALDGDMQEPRVRLAVVHGDAPRAHVAVPRDVGGRPTGRSVPNVTSQVPPLAFGSASCVALCISALRS